MNRKLKKKYWTEQDFGCAEEFIEGIIDSTGNLRCFKRSYLKSENVDSYWTEQEFVCAEGFVEGVIDSDGNLRCIK